MKEKEEKNNTKDVLNNHREFYITLYQSKITYNMSKFVCVCVCE